MNIGNETKLVEVLLVEDNPGDVRLTEEALKDGKLITNLYVVGDGEEALNFLHREGMYRSPTARSEHAEDGWPRGVGGDQKGP